MEGGKYPVIESAAADTTSMAGGLYQTTPPSPSCSSSSPSSSEDHHSDYTGRRRQVNSDPDDSALPTKRRRMTSDLDDSASFMFPHHKDPGQSTSSPGSIMHPSGRMLPVGIAQPMQSRDLDSRDPQPVADWEGKTRPVWKDEGVGEEDETGTLETKPSRPSTDVEDEASVQEVMSQLNTGLSSFESNTSSEEEEEDDEDDEMDSRQQPTPVPQYRNQTEDTYGSTAGGERKSPSSHEDSAIFDLPPGRKHHVFVSHSTGDQAVVKNGIVVPLREARGLKVVACYHCMEKGSQYNDKYIQRAMCESCVVVVGLSPSYLDSQRCQREWRRACELDGREGEEGGGRGCRVVVAALGRCSRPDRLRSYLYLDFIDREKRQHVLQKLVQTIHSTVSDHSESVTEEPEDDAQDEGYGETEAETAANERGSLPLGVLGGCEVGEEGQRRLDREFEEAFSSEQFADSVPQFGGERRREREGRNQSDPRMLDLSSGKMGVKEEEEGDERQSEEVEGEERKRERPSEEVEEGEVSDSSTEDKTSEKKTTSEVGQSEQVAKFYNELARPDADNRDESPIFYMRNFNNWVKSVLIRTYIQPHITVLDLCCGKGGDLLKWKEGGIGYIVCADISESSVEACQGRYCSPRMSARGTGEPPFGAEFHVADCCTVRLRERYKNSGRSFNIVSCQFSVHYSFETYTRAHMMLRNACENLRPGGFFIGTTVDSNEIVRRLREADQRREDGGWYIGNEVFSVTLDPNLDPRESLPLFGAKYNFKLHGVVDLPEYLVHFPLLEEMLKDFDMEMILCQNFTDFFSERRHDPPNANLMFKMQAFNRQTATMPPALWEVIGLYLVYVFRKRDRRTH